MAFTFSSLLLSAIASVRYFQISNKLLSVHPCTEIHSLRLPPTCCQTLCLHISFLPLVTTSAKISLLWPLLLLKKTTQTMAEVMLKTKMKKHLIAGSKVTRNCFSNIPTGSSLRRQKSSVLINSANNRILRKHFCGFIWEIF